MADLNSTRLRKGILFKKDGKIYIVKHYRHIKKGRGLASIRVKVRDIKSGASVEKTFTSNEKVESVDLEYKKAQYLYSDGDIAYFMDSRDFSQFEMREDMIASEKRFLKEGMNVRVTLVEENFIGIEIPKKVTLKVTNAEVGIAGDSANNPTKAVEVETGYSLQVPLFISAGDSIIINTEKGTYVGRG